VSASSLASWPARSTKSANRPPSESEIARAPELELVHFSGGGRGCSGFSRLPHILMKRDTAVHVEVDKFGTIRQSQKS